MNILVIGSGAREHAIVNKLKEDGNDSRIICYPGNGGTGELDKGNEGEELKISTIDEIADFTEKKEIGLTIIGPEKYLAEGIVNEFSAKGLRIFGPTKEGAILETSKTFAKGFMKRNDIPTAQFSMHDSSHFGLGDAFNESLRYLRCGGVVLKADGLAAGKGVYVCDTEDDINSALKDFFDNKKFEKAGEKIVIEKKLEGRELSVLTFYDGKTILPLFPAKDYKRLCDGDKGPNTGGMGAYSSKELCDESLAKRIREEILDRTLEGLQKEKIDYKGIIYFGLMITEEGPKVLEYNCRFGDPETQVVLPRLKNNLLELMIATIEGTLESHIIEADENPAVCVVMASKNYPQGSESGYAIKGINWPTITTTLLHAGTKSENGLVLTNGGRILNVVSKMPTLEMAQTEVYLEVKRIDDHNIDDHNLGHFHYRTDIGK